MNARRIFVTALLIGWFGPGLQPFDGAESFFGQAGGFFERTGAFLERVGRPRTAAAQTPDGARASRPPEKEETGQGGAAKDVLNRALVAIDRHRSISAKTRQRVELFGKQLAGTGSYLEQRLDDGVQLRLEMRFQLADRPCTQLQVSNGRYLWIYEQFSDKPVLGRVDLARVEQAQEENGSTGGEGGLGVRPGLGGLPKLLRGLSDNFDFTAIEEGRLAGQFPVFRLEGLWKSEKLAGMLPAQQQAIQAGKPADLSQLPPHLPHSINLFLGREDLFPYRIEYCRGDAKSSDNGASGADREVAAMELFEVTLGSPIPASRFIYDPTIEYSDRTDQFLAQLGLKK